MSAFPVSFRNLRLAFALAAVAFAGACSYPDIGPDFTTSAKNLDAKTFACCFEPEKFYPAPVIVAAMSLAEQLGPGVSQTAYGSYEDEAYPGKLTGKTEAHEAILAQLRPLDILLIGNTSYQLGRLVPGRFSHSLVYLGTEAELKALGLWNLPEIVPHHAAIRAGEVLIETAAPATRLRSPAKSFEVDRVLVVRPALSSADRREAARRLFAEIGTPISYTMGRIDRQGHYSCTGLIDNAMPKLHLTRRNVYNQIVIMPDDIAAQAIRGDKLKLLTYVLGTDEGYTFRSTYALMVDIAAYWGVPG